MCAFWMDPLLYCHYEVYCISLKSDETYKLLRSLYLVNIKLSILWLLVALFSTDKIVNWVFSDPVKTKLAATSLDRMFWLLSAFYFYLRTWLFPSSIPSHTCPSPWLPACSWSWKTQRSSLNPDGRAVRWGAERRGWHPKQEKRLMLVRG